MKNKTTDKDFKLYCNECKRWAQFFGLLAWNLEFEHSDDTDGGAAATGLNYNQHFARLILAKDVSGHKFTGPNNIREWAFHEVCHIFLADYSDLASRREYSASEHDRVEHAIIVSLQNIIYEPMSQN